MIHAALLAHEGGFTWDEALLVATPLVIVGGLLLLARRRARRGAASADADDVGAE